MNNTKKKHGSRYGTTNRTLGYREMRLAAEFVSGMIGEKEMGRQLGVRKGGGAYIVVANAMRLACSLGYLKIRFPRNKTTTRKGQTK